uniref:FxLD family lantipeptide n=1 Tax=Heterorhabditis bacteriophora TaxID=37862 RepID=A0A1I7W789_HETBA
MPQVLRIPTMLVDLFDATQCVSTTYCCDDS